jgi:hypothetical protein
MSAGKYSAFADIRALALVRQVRRLEVAFLTFAHR